MNNPTQFASALMLLYSTANVALQSGKPNAFLMVALLQSHINMLTSFDNEYCFPPDVVEILVHAAQSACTTVLVELGK